MAPNSHIVGRLISLYRTVLRRQRIDEARHATIACLPQPPRSMGRLEALESRVMLSSVQLNETPKATYTAAPYLVADMQTVFAAGINKDGAPIHAKNAARKFSSH